jgi:CHAT domain-containing protein
LLIKTKIKDRIGEATTLNRIGDLYFQNNLFDEALRYYLRTLPIRIEVKDRQGEGVTLNNIGLIYSRTGLSDEAFDYYQQALSVRREINDRKSEAVTLSNIGLAYNRIGQLEKALEYYEKALFIQREVKNRQGEATELHLIGRVYSVQNKPLIAIQYIILSQEILEERLILTKSDEVKSGTLSQNRYFYNYAILTALEASRADLAFLFSESSRTRLFLDQLGNARPNSRNNSSLAKRLRELEGLYNAKVRVLGMETETDQTRRDQLSKEIDTLANDYKTALAELQRTDPEYASRISAKSLDLAGVQKLLEPNVTLVSFHVLSDKVVAFVIGHDRFKAVTLPIKESELRKQIDDARADQKSPVPEMYSSLYDQLIRPLKAELTTPLVGIVAHGVLHDLPFAALHDREQNQWFGEQKQLFSLPSASSYQFIQAKRKTPVHPNVLALGIEVFNQENLAALTNAETEAKDVIASPYFAGGGNKQLLGIEATKAALLENASSVNVLHLTVHAKVDRSVPRFSRLYLAGQDSLSVADVYDLDLKNASLVVLSACETGVGQVSASEDITSLNRAFIYAGSPSVLASLITVRDDSTSLLMSAFYQGLAKGLTKAGALQAAQSEVRNLQGFENPYFWAYFTLTGDPGR